MKRWFFTLILLAISVVTLFAQQNTSAVQKYALVIGNANYSGISPLNNPVNDANDMEAVLRSLGFNVDKVLNGDLERMESAVENLKRRLSVSRDSYGFFFYAGHGVQANGENYLIPVDASNIRQESHLRSRAVSLQDILSSLSDARNELNMVVLDACRDNPFSWNRSSLRGLSVMNSLPTGTIVMYAAKAGQAASDGTERNGLFTGSLLTNLRTQGLSVFDVFDKTMDAVNKSTNGKQHPELRIMASGAASIYLGSRPLINPNPTPSPSPSPVPSPVPSPALASGIAANMIRIEGGSFTIGSPVNENGRRTDEGPQHQVTVGSFLMSKYEVTIKNYNDIMGRILRVNNPYQSENEIPASCSWYDAIEFCNKLSQKEGLTPVYRGSGDSITCDWNANGYRLPTEAEWEFAAKGGNKEALLYIYSGSNNPETVAHYYDSISVKYKRERKPVGTKNPNILGLYDMSGNVSEWCWDWYGNYTNIAKTNPRGPALGTERVVRGGSTTSSIREIRSASRRAASPHISWEAGFRVVRTVTPGSR